MRISVNDRVRFVVPGMEVSSGMIRQCSISELRNSSPHPALTIVSRLRGILDFTRITLQSLSESEDGPQDL